MEQKQITPEVLATRVLNPEKQAEIRAALWTGLGAAVGRMEEPNQPIPESLPFQRARQGAASHLMQAASRHFTG